ncbi:hypothetical protein FQN54_006579 [Arachnomyces sp. PD_36]|nr:hypothetical protein FQN54_006579 [Arachnomyces sp. PD_36]
MPPEYIRECFKTDVRSWEASEQCRQLTSTLISASSSKVDKIVAFACNTISDPEEEYASRSTFQHALILTIRDILANKDGNPKDIACYAQDPAYTNTDRSVLAEAGITVLDDPEGFLIADESTVVISCASNVPVKQIISDITQPAIMVWDRIRGETRQIDGKEFNGPGFSSFTTNG